MLENILNNNIDIEEFINFYYKQKNPNNINIHDLTSISDNILKSNRIMVSHLYNQIYTSLNVYTNHGYGNAIEGSHDNSEEDSEEENDEPIYDEYESKISVDVDIEENKYTIYKEEKEEKEEKEGKDDLDINNTKKRLVFDLLKNSYILNYSRDEYNYYKNLDPKTKEYIGLIEKYIKSVNYEDIPKRFQLIFKEMSLEMKSQIMQKININKKKSILHNDAKFQGWLHGLLKIPFGKYIDLPITRDNSKKEINDYLVDVQKKLDVAVYGHKSTKRQVVQLIAEWVSNPASNGKIIGIQGPMGNGKTTLVKYGISKALDRPFHLISLGGAQDSSYLNGHGYTYEGSTWGRVVDVLMQSNCMNPVFYFDELDKVSDTPRGKEITNLLIHLTDLSQNDKFQDRYFSGVDIDLSRAVFIFSYNEEEKNQ